MMQPFQCFFLYAIDFRQAHRRDRRSDHKELILKPFHSLLVLALGVATFGAQPVLAQDALRIGAPLSLTGALAPEGAKLKQGYELWQEKVNAAGGIQAGDKKLKIVRLPVHHAEGSSARRKTHQRRQGGFPILAIRFRCGQGGECGRGKIQRAAAGFQRVIGGGLRPGLQKSVRSLHG